MKKQSGFTLVELMIVMAIIAILATAGISAYTEYLKKARDTTRVQIASQVNTAVTALMGANGGIPPTSVELIAELDTMNMSAAMEALEVGNPRYLSSVSSVMKGIGNVVGIPTLSALIDEPSGGKAICLGYTGGEVVGGQSCAFRYIVYGDNTYVVGYGIEHESNMQKNFYKIATTAVGTNSGTPQYMQVVGTAEYVGLPSIGEVGGPAKPDTTNPFGASKITIDGSGAVTQPDFTSEIVVANSATLSDETTGGGGGGGTLITGDPCTTGSECASGICGNYRNQGNVCRTDKLFIQCSNDSECGDGFICSTYNGCTDRQIGSPCDNGSQCVSNFCNQATGNSVPYTCTTGEAGVGCFDDTNCQSGLSCTPPGDGGICTSGGGGGGGGGGGTGQDGDLCSDTPDCVGWCGRYQYIPDLSTYGRQCTSSSPLFGRCSSDAQCGNGFICTMYEGCSDHELNSPCSSNEHCNSGYCYLASAGPQGGFDAFTCTTGAAGVGCRDDSNCQPGLRCALIPEQFEGGVCVTLSNIGESCSVDSDCQSELYCGANNTCSSGAIGEPCNLNTTGCPISGYCNQYTWICTDGSIGSYCYYDSGCQPSYYCSAEGNTEGICTDGGPGAECYMDSVCQNGDCSEDGTGYPGTCN